MSKALIRPAGVYLVGVLVIIFVAGRILLDIRFLVGLNLEKHYYVLLDSIILIISQALVLIAIRHLFNLNRRAMYYSLAAFIVTLVSFFKSGGLSGVILGLINPILLLLNLHLYILTAYTVKFFIASRPGQCFGVSSQSSR